MSSYGPYEVIRSLAGDRSEAHLARREASPEGQEYVLIPLDVVGDDASRLADELERCRGLAHPALASVVEVFGHRGRPVLVYDSTPGTNLHRLTKHLWKSGERLPLGVVLHVGQVLFDALGAAHEAEREGRRAPLVHGQLGLHQVLLSWRGGVGLFGCGLYRLYRAVEMLHGVPDLMRPFVAPENRNGSDPTPASNVFSAAAMVHALLGSRLPLEDALTFEPLRRVEPDLPEEIATALDRALAPSPKRRTIGARALAEMFERAAPDEGKQQLVELLEQYRELEHVDAGVMPPECVPPLLQAGHSEPPPGAPGSVVYVPRLAGVDQAGRGLRPSNRPHGKGVYAIVGGRELPVDAGDEANDEERTGTARRRANQTLPGSGAGRRGGHRGKPKHTMPGTGAAAWRQGVPAGDAAPDEVPEAQDTWPGSGGPADGSRRAGREPAGGARERSSAPSRVRWRRPGRTAPPCRGGATVADVDQRCR